MENKRFISGVLLSHALLVFSCFASLGVESPITLFTRQIEALFRGAHHAVASDLRGSIKMSQISQWARAFLCVYRLASSSPPANRAMG